jgi:dTDP-4-amino-4,6-dideoxygalactose transaminase
MVTTASDEWAARIRVAALHGMSRDAWSRYERGGSAHYDVVMAGFKYNMMDLQAAIGLRQLDRLDEMGLRRARVWDIYDEGLAALPVERPRPVAAGAVHARHLYTILVDEQRCGWTRDVLQAQLHAAGIGTSLHFRALHLLTFYRERFALMRGMFPNAEYISDRTLSLPLSGATTDDEARRVVTVLGNLMARSPRRSDAGVAIAGGTR